MNNSDPFFRIVPLGGLGRIGGNMMVYETAEDIFIVDCGVLFPHSEQSGLDFVIPNVEYLLAHKRKIRGLVLTHAHEDHIGAIPFVLPQLGIAKLPIYGTRFTLAMLRMKLVEYAGRSVELIEFRDNVPFWVAKTEITPIPVTHSIPGAVMLALSTPIGKVIHTGDFKLDPYPTDGRLSDEAALGKLGDEGVALLLSDSTNSEKKGHTWSEQEVDDSLAELIMNAPRRVFVTTFASHIHRLQAVIHASARAGRVVIPVGRSMQQNVQMALEQGFLKAASGTIRDVAHFANAAPWEVTVIASGSQGEMKSAMPRIAAGQFSQVKLEPGDRVIVSSRRIPGNERGIGVMLNNLYRMGADVIDDQAAKVHTSGHAYNDEQRRVLDLCRPRYFVPLHGEYRHMTKHAALARQSGVDASRIFVVEDGQPIEFRKSGNDVSARLLDRINASPVYVDHGVLGDDVERALRERRICAEAGFVTCVATLSEGIGLVAGPELVCRGMVFEQDAATVAEDAARDVEKAVKACGKKAKDEEILEEMRLAIRRFFRREYDRRPLIVPMLVKV